MTKRPRPGAVLPVFRRHHRGVLINVGSVARPRQVRYVPRVIALGVLLPAVSEEP